MPYRTAALVTPKPSLYGIWAEPHQRSWLVRFGVSDQRWGLRSTDGAFPVHEPQNFSTAHEVCKRLEFERVLTGRDDVFYVVDRKTGKAFCPPVSVLYEILAELCPLCKATTCDPGLHS